MKTLGRDDKQDRWWSATCGQICGSTPVGWRGPNIYEVAVPGTDIKQGPPAGEMATFDGCTETLCSKNKQRSGVKPEKPKPVPTVPTVRAVVPRTSVPKLIEAAPVTSLKLDLGCGQNPKEGFEGVDILELREEAGEVKISKLSEFYDRLPFTAKKTDGNPSR